MVERAVFPNPSFWRYALCANISGLVIGSQQFVFLCGERATVQAGVSEGSGQRMVEQAEIGIQLHSLASIELGNTSVALLEGYMIGVNEFLTRRLQNRRGFANRFDCFTYQVAIAAAKG